MVIWNANKLFKNNWYDNIIYNMLIYFKLHVGLPFRINIHIVKGRRGRDRMQSVPITTDVVSSNLDQGEVYNIMWSSLSVTCDRSVVFSGYSGFLYQ